MLDTIKLITEIYNCENKKSKWN